MRPFPDGPDQPAVTLWAGSPRPLTRLEDFQSAQAIPGSAMSDSTLANDLSARRFSLSAIPNGGEGRGEVALIL